MLPRYKKNEVRTVEETLEQELQNRFERLKEELLANEIQEFRNDFLEMHYYEQGQFYQSLTTEERMMLYSLLSPKEMADMFDVLEEDNDNMSDYLAEMRPSYAANMLSEMYSDNAVDILNTLDKKQMAMYLSLMEKEVASEIRELLHYEDENRRIYYDNRICFDCRKSNRAFSDVCLKIRSQRSRNYLLYLCCGC